MSQKINYFILAFISLITLSSTERKSSLVFVIDDTASMRRDVDQVKSGANSIMDIILNSNSSQIENMLLVTFNDPAEKVHSAVSSFRTGTAAGLDGLTAQHLKDLLGCGEAGDNLLCALTGLINLMLSVVTLRAKTNDSAEFKRKLSDITVQGGNDCPEMSLTGLQLGLQLALHGSFIYVFTDDTAKDQYLLDEVKDLCIEKKSQVIFVVTPNTVCIKNDPYKDFASYHAIANISGGQVFRLHDKNDVQYMPSFVKETVNGETTILTSRIVLANEFKYIPFTIDEQVESAIVSTSGDSVSLDIIEGPTRDFKPIVWIKNVKIAKLNDPGHYVARVRGLSVTSAVVFGRTDFVFDYGFSIFPVNTIDQTIKKPYADVDAYLFISVEDSRHLIKVDSVEILNMDEKLITSFPLNRVWRDLYSTPSFAPSRTTFKIAVVGHIISSGRKLRRIAKIPVETVIQSMGKPIILSNGKTKYEGVVGDVALRIPCKAIGNPKPNIIWIHDGADITPNDKYSIIDDGTLVIQKLTDVLETNYICKTVNTHGEDKMNFTVVISPFIDNNGFSKKIYILEHQNKQLDCILPSNINATQSQFEKILWFKNDEFEHAGMLVFEDASPSDDGNYTCRITNEYGAETGITWEVDVGYPPSLKNFESETILWKGELGYLSCEVSSKPLATIEWYKNGRLIEGAKFSEFYYYDWGNYTCRTSNVHGVIQRNFSVISNVCLINKIGMTKYIPVFLDESLAMPHLENNEQFIVLPSQKELTFSCQKPNTFRNFNEKSEIKVTCDHEDNYLVDEKLYRFSELQCMEKVEPIIKAGVINCLNENTKQMKIGFNGKKFIDVADVCLDVNKNTAVYTKTELITHEFYQAKLSLRSSNKTKNNENEKIMEPGFDSACYFTKGWLVNPTDVIYGPAQTAVSKNWNQVFYWKCKNSSWEDVEESVRKITTGQNSDRSPKFTVWSGTIGELETKSGHNVPMYLWKVVKNLNTMESLAIVHINSPYPDKIEVPCKNRCKINWYTSPGKPTYCCQLSDFMEKFNIPKKIFSTPDRLFVKN